MYRVCFGQSGIRKGICWCKNVIPATPMGTYGNMT